MYVVAGHMCPGRPFLLAFGQEAVMVFFLLSGFVIEFSSAKSLGKGFGHYFWRRFTRIYSVLILLFVGVCLLQHTDLSDPGFWKVLAGNLAMLQDFESAKPAVIVPTLFASALWSLHYEWWFYMAYFPLAARVSPLTQTQCQGWIGVAAAIVYAAHPNMPARLAFYFCIWWTGVVLARSYRAKGCVEWADALLPGAFLAAISVILAVPCLWHLHAGGHFQPGVHPFIEFRHVASTLSLLVVALVWQKLHWIGFRPLLGWGIWVAPISYALYISHQPLLTQAGYLGWINNPVLRGGLYVAILLLFCGFAELKFYPFVRRQLLRRA